MADGKALPAGTYQVRVTADEAKPEAVGTTEPLERWVEFVQGGQVKGREVVSIVPAAEAKQVVKDAAPPPAVLQGPEPERQRIRPGVVQQGRKSLPDQPGDRHGGSQVKGAGAGARVPRC